MKSIIWWFFKVQTSIYLFECNKKERKWWYCDRNVCSWYEVKLSQLNFCFIWVLLSIEGSGNIFVPFCVPSHIVWRFSIFFGWFVFTKNHMLLLFVWYLVGSLEFEKWEMQISLEEWVLELKMYGIQRYLFRFLTTKEEYGLVISTLRILFCSFILALNNKIAFCNLPQLGSDPFQLIAILWELILMFFFDQNQISSRDLLLDIFYLKKHTSVWITFDEIKGIRTAQVGLWTIK